MPQLQPERITEAVCQYMIANLVVFQFEVVPPSIFEIHLAKSDHARLSPLFKRAEQDIARGLDSALDDWEAAQNPESAIGKVLAAVRNPLASLRGKKREMARPASWTVTFLDAPGLPDGEFEVSGLVDDERPAAFLEGKKTVCVKTRYSTRQTSMEGAPPVSPAPERRLLARISFEDMSGSRVYEMQKDAIKIGRAAPGYWSDIALETDAGVSREHLEIRFDPATSQFVARPFALRETTVNGESVIREHPLPRKATIVLAGKITLNFEAVETAE